MAFNRCEKCKKKFVPEVLLASIEPPPELDIIGDGMLIEAHVCRQKKIKLGYSKPTDVSEVFLVKVSRYHSFTMTSTVSSCTNCEYMD
jgi:hypothetical protein